MSKDKSPSEAGPNFIKQIILEDLEKGKNAGKVVTRFPPEPNGYLHVGHTKSIGINFGLAKEFNGTCHLRFDDTNPVAEDPEFVKAIQEDIQWMGYNWGENLFYASDYFDQLFEFAVALIKKGLAYVDDQNVDEIRAGRGSLTEPGKDSPFRTRSIEENLDLFERMRSGEFDEGAKVLRAKIDMASPNMNLRDPLLYRIRKVEHQRTGDKWCIYPLYDFTHGLSDMIEGITHSICTLEFEDHRPLYDWFLEVLETPCHPQQIEFARGNIDYTVMSKRLFLQLIDEGHVNGWDDPRMPTVRGMRRRGFTPESLRMFWERAGVTKKNSVLSLSNLEWAVREDLDSKADRAMAVLDPIKLVIENYPEGQSEDLDGPVHPKNPERGRRTLPFSQEIYIDRDDFMEDPPKKYFRLKPGGKVRLRYGYVVECKEVIKDDSGKVVEIKCEYDPRTKGGVTPEGEKKVKGIIHWVCARHGLPAEIRLYDRLFQSAKPGKNFKEDLNPGSLKVLKNAWVEPGLKGVQPETRLQFERLGYFVADWKDCTSEKLVFNQTVTLRDTWANS